MIELPGGKGRYMLLEELILHYIGKVFKGYKVKGKSLIRVVRNADIDADALYDEDLDYREFMADLMKQRKKLSPVRLDMSREMDQAVIEHYAGIWRSHRTGYSRVKHRWIFHLFFRSRIC